MTEEKLWKHRLTLGSVVAFGSQGGLFSSLFQKYRTVPPETVALVLREENSFEVRQVGESVGPYQEVWFFLTSPFELTFTYCDVSGQDDYLWDRLILSLSFAVLPKFPHLQLFLQTFRSERGNLVDSESIASFLYTPLEERLRELLRGQYRVANFYEQPAQFRTQLEKDLREILSPLLFDTGLEFRQIHLLEGHSSAYEEALRAREKAQKELYLQEMQKRLEEEKINAEKEAEKLRRYLAYQGVLEEIELSKRLQERKKEEELRKFEELKEKLGHDETKALIFLLEDENLRAKLIEKLIEREMTPEQLAAKRKLDQVRELEAQVSHFKEKLERALKGSPTTVSSPQEVSRLAFVVYNQHCSALEPGRSLRPEKEFSFASKGLGYLRSVRVTPEGHLLLGAQKGVYTWTVSKDTLWKTYEYPTPPRGRGGVNSTAIWEDVLFASHSEMGVTSWHLFGLHPPRQLFESICRPAKSVRGLTFYESHLYVAADQCVLESEPEFEEVKHRYTADSMITCFVLWQDNLYAGTESGRLYTWKIGQPDSREQLPFRKGGALYMLKVCLLGERAYLLVGARDYAVHAIPLDGGPTLEYQAKEPIRWVDGASDYIYGVGRSGFHLYIWAVDAPEQIYARWSAPDKIQDLWLWRRHQQEEIGATVDQKEGGS